MKAKNIFKDRKFAAVVGKHIKELVSYLIENTDGFAIVAKAKHLNIEPEVKEIPKDSDEYIRLDIVNYSFDTSAIDGDKLVFQAGFGGGENIVESRVEINLIHIKQILTLDIEPIYTNPVNEIAQEERDRAKPSGTVDRAKLFS